MQKYGWLRNSICVDAIAGNHPRCRDLRFPRRARVAALGLTPNGRDVDRASKKAHPSC